MDIKDLLSPEVMIFNLQGTSKEAVLNEMVQQLYDKNYITSVEAFREQIFNREKQGSTGLGDGIAIPHGKSRVVKAPVVLFAKNNKGIDFNSLDGEPAHLFFMIAAPEGANNTHLEALASLSRQLIHPEVVEQLKKAATPEEVQSAFETSTISEDSNVKQNIVEKDTPLIVAVTACPTGIAHTYMAEDALKI